MATGRSSWWEPLRPLVLLVVVAVLGVLFGLGNSAVLGGTVATFLMAAAFGGSLYSDLRLMGWFGPALVLEVGLISLLNGPVPLAADLLVVLAVFVAGLLPVLGPRFAPVAAGLGIAAVFARATSSSGTTAVQAFGAPALALVVVIALRVLAGRSDPTGPVRAAVADALVDLSPTVGENAARAVDAHHPSRWITEAATGLARYRAAAVLLSARRARLDGTAADEVDRHRTVAATEACRLATAVRGTHRPDALPPVRHDHPSAALPGATERLVEILWQGLERVRVACAGRDATAVDRPPLPLRPSVPDVLRGELRWGSLQLRHAVRVALGMGVALAFLRFQGTPFGVTFLLATYTTMQPTWMDSARKAGERVLGTLIGAAAVGGVVWLDLPQAALTGLGAVGLVIGYYFQRSRPVAGNAGLTFMSVAVTSLTRSLNPAEAVVLCLEVSAFGIAIGLVFGFVAVPGIRRRSPRERLADAVAAQRVLLEDVAVGLRRGAPDPRILGGSARTAIAAVVDLTADEAGSPLTEQQRDATEWAAQALRETSATAVALLLSPDVPFGPSAALAPAVDEVARQLRLDHEPDLVAVTGLLPGRSAPSSSPVADADTTAEQELVVDTMIAGLLAVREVDTVLSTAAH